MIYFTAHTINCVCHSMRTMFRVLGIYNFGATHKYSRVHENSTSTYVLIIVWNCKLYKSVLKDVRKNRINCN